MFYELLNVVSDDVFKGKCLFNGEISNASFNILKG